MTSSAKGFNSKLVHAGNQRDVYGAAITPIYQTSTFAFRSADDGAARFAGRVEGYIYTRIGNPTIRALEDCVAELENGCGAVATSSGMGALTTLCLALLSSGDHVVSTAAVYGPSRALLQNHFARFGVRSTFVDTTDLGQVVDAFQDNTRLVFVETPSNPLLQITDIAAVAELAHQRGAVLAVDSTFASPYLQRPLELGADVALHSVTKFVNGHADVVGGLLIARQAERYRRLRDTMIGCGTNMDPHQAFLVHRGLKTLALRLQRAQESATQIAAWLEARPEIAWVRHPSLVSHPQHQLAQRQMAGPGALVGPVGDHLVDVHVRLGAAAGLPDREGELAVVFALEGLVGGADDGLALLLAERAQLHVDDGRGLLHQHQRLDERMRHLLGGDVEVVERALGLRSPVLVRGNLDGAERVLLDARLLHGCPLGDSMADFGADFNGLADSA